MTDRVKRYAKRGPVIMPVQPPFDILQWMAGDPIVLAASDEQTMREFYNGLRKRLALRKDRRP